MTAATAVAGHNAPPLDDQAALRERLTDRHKALLARVDELLWGENDCPKPVDDTTATQVQDYVNLIKACDAEFEKQFKDEKQPFLDGGRTVDAWFRDPRAKLTMLKDRLNGPRETYLKEKQRRLEREQAEATERLRKEAEAAAAVALEAADKGGPAAEAAFDHAVVAHEAAVKAETAPVAKAKIASSFGGSSGLRKEWTFKDLDKDKIDLAPLRPYLDVAAIEKAIRKYIAANKPTPKQIAGVTIFEDEKVR